MKTLIIKVDKGGILLRTTAERLQETYDSLSQMYMYEDQKAQDTQECESSQTQIDLSSTTAMKIGGWFGIPCLNNP